MNFRVINNMFDKLKRKHRLHKYLTQIRRFSDYRWNENTNEQYVFSRERQYEHFTKFNLKELAGNGTVKEKALRIMKWVNEFTAYNGASLLPPSDSERILQYVETENREINCANRSILFADALLSVGIFAMPIWLAGCAVEKDKTLSEHSHVIAQVWLEEEKQWAVFDPSFNVWFEVNGKPADISQMLKSVRSRDDYVTVSNVTNRRFDRAGDCTRIGLLDIGFCKGNILGEKLELFHVVPDSFFEWISEYGQGWKIEEKMRKSINYILGEPVWTVDS